jgi:hypothetical protein
MDVSFLLHRLSVKQLLAYCIIPKLKRNRFAYTLFFKNVWLGFDEILPLAWIEMKTSLKPLCYRLLWRICNEKPEIDAWIGTEKDAPNLYSLPTKVDNSPFYTAACL